MMLKMNGNQQQAGGFLFKNQLKLRFLAFNISRLRTGFCNRRVD